MLNIQNNQVNRLLVYINHDELVKEESVTMNSMKVSVIKTTHGSKILPEVKKQINNVTNYI